MPTYAYLRVSTDAQDAQHQKHGILEYANQMGLTDIQFVEDTVSGRKKWQERKLGKLLSDLAPGDSLIFSEISRIARSTLQVLDVLEFSMLHKVNVHIAKQNMRLDGSLQSTITATVLGLAAEIEREFISTRTREALAAKRAQGIIGGRPKGPAATHKLDKKRRRIEEYLQAGLSQRAIAKLIDEPASTVNDYIRRNALITSSNHNDHSAR
ncbi:recombinase family protein [Vibrio sp. Of7-15]|uniref:recombinase family protein n=1 Tax=Vibrio sp. Of7-15 TaxID=2724879 RepID=UPI001EF3B3D7|nr:recombinase family protein [Vibrio sp. Of7-15]MCG7500026.1 recombinase family protein [Vibrio sp. Of7-15]